MHNDKPQPTKLQLAQLHIQLKETYTQIQALKV